MTEMTRALTVPDLNKVKALAILSRAEAALAEASDINDILQLREDGAAFAAMATAKKMEDVAQQAKVFQLRAERKAGDWYDLLPKDRGGARPTGDARTDGSRPELLSEIAARVGVPSRTLSFWHTMSKVPERAFSAWVRDCLEQREEISQRALLRLAKPTAPPSPPEKPMSLLDRWADKLKEVSVLLYEIGAYKNAKEAKLHLSYAKHAVASVTTMLADAKALVADLERAAKEA